MISALVLFYFTIFVFFQMGMRMALTRIDTKIFLMIILTTWILIKNIT